MNFFPVLPFSLFLLLDFLGVFAGAIGGGLEAMRYNLKTRSIREHVPSRF